MDKPQPELERSSRGQLMEEIIGGLRLAFKEAGINTKKANRYYSQNEYGSYGCFMAMWKCNWFLVSVTKYGYVAVEPMKYCKSRKLYTRVCDGKYGIIELIDPGSIPYLIWYVKLKRKARGRFV